LYTGPEKANFRLSTMYSSTSLILMLADAAGVREPRSTSSLWHRGIRISNPRHSHRRHSVCVSTYVVDVWSSECRSGLIFTAAISVMVDSPSENLYVTIRVRRDFAVFFVRLLVAVLRSRVIRSYLRYLGYIRTTALLGPIEVDETFCSVQH
jgi:hypothetical protein